MYAVIAEGKGTGEPTSFVQRFGVRFYRDSSITNGTMIISSFSFLFNFFNSLQQMHMLSQDGCPDPGGGIS